MKNYYIDLGSSTIKVYCHDILILKKELVKKI